MTAARAKSQNTPDLGAVIQTVTIAESEHWGAAQIEQCTPTKVQQIATRSHTTKQAVKEAGEAN
jgi:hypothetical protein